MIKVYLHEIICRFMFSRSESNYITQGPFLIRWRPLGHGSFAGISLYKRNETAPQYSLTLEYEGGSPEIKKLVAKIGTREAELDATGVYCIKFPEVANFMLLGETDKIVLTITLDE